MAGKGLRRLLSEEPPIEELQSVFNQAANDTNDRAAALISASLLDGALQRAIEARLWLDKMEVSEKLFGGRGGEPIIGSFGAKIVLGMALRIYGEETYANLNRVRMVRNAFAHSQRALNFAIPEISEVCAQIRNRVVPYRPRVPFPETPKQQYVYCALALFLVFTEAARQTRTGDNLNVGFMRFGFQTQKWTETLP